MSGPYQDIIDMPHPVSARRKRMTMHDRAAQFSPFAALTGFDAAIRESGRLTQGQVEHGEDALTMLDEKLRLAALHLAERPEVTVTYFLPDERKSGGRYVEVTGRVCRIDRCGRGFVLEDGSRIPFDRIREITGALFGDGLAAAEAWGET